MQGSMESVETMIHEKNQANPFRVPPTETLPSIPPTKCEHKQQADCIQCAQFKEWWAQYTEEVDELLYLSNVHSCVTRNKSSAVSQGAQKI